MAEQPTTLFDPPAGDARPPRPTSRAPGSPSHTPATRKRTRPRRAPAAGSPCPTAACCCTCPTPTASASSRNWTRRWTQPGLPGTCDHSGTSSRRGGGWCLPANAAAHGGRPPRRGCAAARSPIGRANRWMSTMRSAAISNNRPGGRASYGNEHYPEFSQLVVTLSELGARRGIYSGGKSTRLSH